MISTSFLKEDTWPRTSHNSRMIIQKSGVGSADSGADVTISAPVLANASWQMEVPAFIDMVMAYSIL